MTHSRRWCALVVLAGGAWAGRCFGRVEVVGESMLPALEPGDRLLLSRLGRPRLGDVVAVADPRQPDRTVVKRLVAVSPAGLTVLGDHAAASTDSRVFGPVPSALLRGRVVYRYHPEHRRGRVPNRRLNGPLVT